MDMKIALTFLAVVFAAVNGNYYQLSFKENQHVYMEAVRTDSRQNIVEIEVPAHEARNALGVLNDFSTGYSAKKAYKNNICYISKIEPEMPTPEKTAEFMAETGGQFQNAQYIVVNVKMFPIRNMTSEEVGPKIAAFCYGFDMMLTAEFDKDDVDTELGKLVRGSEKGTRIKRQSGSSTIAEVRNACEQDSSLASLRRCPHTFNFHCKWRSSDCYYWIRCVRDGVDEGHSCEAWHPILSEVICCNYVCP